MMSAPDGIITPRRGLRFLTGDILLYGGAAAVSKSAALITFPLLARSYTVADYGVIDFFLVFGTLAALIMVWGLDSAVGRYFWKYEDFKSRRILISQVFLFQLLAIVGLLAAFWSVRDWLAPRLLDHQDAGRLMGVALLQVPFLVLINFCRNLLKWTFRRSAFLWLTVGATLLQTGLLALAVLVVEVSIMGVLAVYAITNAATAAVGLVLIRMWLVWPGRTIEPGSVLRYAVPLGVVSVLGALGPVLERSLVSTNLGLHELGLLAAAAKTAMVLTLFIAAFQTAWGPYYMSLHKSDGHQADSDKVLRVFTFAICLAVLCFATLVTPLLKILASDRYLPAYEVAVLIALASGIRGVGWIAEIGIHISFRSTFLPIGHGLGILVTALVLWVFLPSWGVIAAGVGVVGGAVIGAVALAMIAQRIHPMTWSFGPVIACVALTSALVFAALWAGRAYGVAGFIGVSAGGVVLFPPIGARLLFSANERRRIFMLRAWLAERR